MVCGGFFSKFLLHNIDHTTLFVVFRINFLVEVILKFGMWDDLDIVVSVFYVNGLRIDIHLMQSISGQGVSVELLLQIVGKDSCHASLTMT